MEPNERSAPVKVWLLGDLVAYFCLVRCVALDPGSLGLNEFVFTLLLVVKGFASGLQFVFQTFDSADSTAKVFST